MNTRVQVEHCVTEATTGVDIVREQIRIAAGEELSSPRTTSAWHGHAIECRINAEDAAKNFAPAPGTVTAYVEPSGPGVRVDSGVLAGSEITPLYDPMVAKLIVWDADRETATRRMLRALDEFQIEGVRTLIPFHKAIMASEQWANAETCRDLIEDRKWLKTLAQPKPRRPRRTARRSSATTSSRSPASASRSRCAATPAAAQRRGAGRARRARGASAASAAAAARAATRSSRPCRATSSRCWSSRAPRSRRARSSASSRR